MNKPESSNNPRGILETLKITLAAFTSFMVLRSMIAGATLEECEAAAVSSISNAGEYGPPQEVESTSRLGWAIFRFNQLGVVTRALDITVRGYDRVPANQEGAAPEVCQKQGMMKIRRNWTSIDSGSAY